MAKATNRGVLINRWMDGWVKDRSDDPSHHERTLLPRSYISLLNKTQRHINIVIFFQVRAGRSSEVERSLMVRWVVRSILNGVDPLSYFSFQPVLHDWCNKGRGMCYPVCEMVHIK